MPKTHSTVKMVLHMRLLRSASCASEFVVDKAAGIGDGSSNIGVSFMRVAVYWKSHLHIKGSACTQK